MPPHGSSPPCWPGLANGRPGRTSPRPFLVAPFPVTLGPVWGTPARVHWWGRGSQERRDHAPDAGGTRRNPRSLITGQVRGRVTCDGGDGHLGERDVLRRLRT